MRNKYFLKLRGALAGKGFTLLDMANELTITQQALNEKLQGRTQFTLEEMINTCNWLDEQLDIFFDHRLHNLQFLESNKTA